MGNEMQGEGYCRRGVTGGASRNRTDVHGFAIRCITTLPLRQYCKKKGSSVLAGASFCIWSGRRVSNSRPQPWQGCALPTELLPHGFAVPSLTLVALRRANHFLLPTAWQVPLRLPFRGSCPINLVIDQKARILHEFLGSCWPLGLPSALADRNDLGDSGCAVLPSSIK